MSPLRLRSIRPVRVSPGLAVAVAVAVPVPAEFFAATVNVYCVPLARPVTVAVVPVTSTGAMVVPAGPVVVTVYPVTGASPTGAVHDRATDPRPGVAVTAVGAPGRVTGVVVPPPVPPVPPPVSTTGGTSGPGWTGGSRAGLAAPPLMVTGTVVLVLPSVTVIDAGGAFTGKEPAPEASSPKPSAMSVPEPTVLALTTRSVPSYSAFVTVMALTGIVV